MPYTLSVLFHDGTREFWVTEQQLDVGDKITRNGQTWIVTSLGEFDQDGKPLAVILRPDDEMVDVSPAQFTSSSRASVP